jgi:hypothetical protein
MRGVNWDQCVMCGTEPMPILGMTMNPSLPPRIDYWSCRCALVQFELKEG